MTLYCNFIKTLNQENGWYVDSKETGASSNLSSGMISSGHSTPCSEHELSSSNQVILCIILFKRKMYELYIFTLPACLKITYIS